MKFRNIGLFTFILAVVCLVDFAAFAAELTRSVIDDGTCTPTVTILVTPDAIQTYVVEERLPYGVVPSNISGNGVWDASARTIRWGLYTDAGQTLSYDITGPDLNYEFKNLGSFDGSEQTITGTMQATIVCTVDISQVATPVFDPVSGTTNSAAVSLSTATTDARIHYTTDGTPPDTGSAGYDDTPIPLSGQTTIRAIAVKEGMVDSDIANAVYPVLPHTGLSTIIDSQTCPPVVTITVNPESSVSSYALEAMLSGGAIPGNIDQDGEWDPVNKKIKWGVFNDSLSRTLSFELLGEIGEYSIYGAASFDGKRYAMSGDIAAIVTCALARVATPQFSIEPGTPVPITGLAVTSATEGAEIHYTMDNSEPDRRSPVYTGPFDLTSETTVRARAFKDGMMDSFMGGAHYPFIYIRGTSERLITHDNECSADVSISVIPVEGYSSYAVVENIPATAFVSDISDGGKWDPAGRTIRWGLFVENTARTVSYKLTGTKGVQNLNGSVSFDGETESTTGDRQAIIACEPPEKTARPVFDPAGGTLVPVDAAISSSTPGAAIHYTIDGSLPEPGSALYTVPLHFDSKTVLRARAFCDNMFPSEPVSAVYHEAGVADQSQATRNVSVDQSCQDTIRIVVTPDENVQSYAVKEVLPQGLSPLNIDNNGTWDGATQTLRWGPFNDNAGRTFSYDVKGTDNAYRVEGQVSFNGQTRPVTGETNITIACLTAQEQVIAPVIDPGSGTVVPVDVSITSATQGAEIRYTTDGSLPMPGSALYAGPLHLESRTALRARAFVDGMLPSQSVLSNYVEGKEDPYTQLNRSIVNTEACVSQIDITVTPADHVHSYAMEEILPDGLVPMLINNAGSWDEDRRKIMWGPFPDNASRTFSYDLIGMPDSYALDGAVSFDGSYEKLPGQTTVTLTCLDDRVSGISARYLFDGDAFDHSGYGNNGTVYGVLQADDRFGNEGAALAFNGVDSYIQVTDSPSLQITDTISISFWAKRNQFTGREIVLEKADDTFVDYGVALDGADPSESMVLFYFAGGTRGVTGVLDTQWHHYAVVARDNDADPMIYIDGYRKTLAYTDGAPLISLNAGSADIYIGGNPLTEEFSDILIDDLIIYDRFVTGGEIQQLASETPDPPALSDLMVNSVTWVPETDIAGDDVVTFTAAIANIGEGTSIYPFRVNFEINGVSIGAELLAKTIRPGDAAQITKSWTAVPGLHNLRVIADSSQGIPETDEENNELTVDLPRVFDRTPPEDVTGLGVIPGLTSLRVGWVHSADTVGDLAGYRVYLDGVSTGIDVDSDENSFEILNLEAATAYAVKVTAFDTDGNESAGISITGATLLLNPTDLVVEAQTGYAELSWSPASPSELVKHYAVYVSESDFNTVENMTPAVIASETSVKVAGLTNGITYYFAVTTINISNGETKEVTAVSGTPEKDTRGPDIAGLRWDNENFVDGITLRALGFIHVNASDPVGVSHVDFLVDGQGYFRDSSGPTAYQCLLNLTPFTDGEHHLTINVYDSLGNISSQTHTFFIDLDLPDAPHITGPPHNTFTNNRTIFVSGTLENLSDGSCQLILFHGTATGDKTELGIPASVDSQGNFSTTITLSEDDNFVAAKARNRKGDSSFSNEILIHLDTTLPHAPTHLETTPKEGGTIRINWQKPEETSPIGYNVYRSTASFSEVSQAEKINSTLITELIFSDLTPEDRDYYYRVTTLNAAETESGLSEESHAVSDRSRPKVVLVTYMPQGNYSLDSGRMTLAPGRVDVDVTISEPLQSLPFFNISISGASPIAVTLLQTGETSYSGFFILSESTPSGDGFALFSGRDMVGNRGTQVESGSTIAIDTQGPEVTRIEIQPKAPVKNDSDNPVLVTVTMGLNEKIKEGNLPEFSCLLSGPGRTSIQLGPLVEIAPSADEAQAFQTSFDLPFDAGLDEGEFLAFQYLGSDALDNESSTILCDNRFEIYQGDLPPFAAPIGLKGEPLAGGKIKLSWLEVTGGQDYQVYRRTEHTEFTEYARSGNAVEFIDEVTENGILYTYAVATIRAVDSEEAFSARSDSVSITADSVPPGAPGNLELELTSRGILVQWEAPPLFEAITYSLYRSDAEITTIEGLTPLADQLDLTEVIDPAPSATEHWYAVTAVDGCTNQSVPSNSAYLNADLLPVSSVTVVQEDHGYPGVTWTHGGVDIEYDIYLETGSQDLKLNQDGRIQEKSYTDTGYGSDARRYRIVAVDSNGAESLGRSITLPFVQAHLLNGADISDFQSSLTDISAYVPDLEEEISGLSMPARRIMNRLKYLMENGSSETISNIKLHLMFDGHDHVSETFSLEPGEFMVIPVIVGGYSDLPDTAALVSMVEINPGINETIQIIRNSEIAIHDGMLVLGILNEEFTRGVSGTICFTLENTCDEKIQIVSATENNKNPSGQVRLNLLDEDENVLSSAGFKQTIKAEPDDNYEITTLSNGVTVIGIPPGKTFTSAPLEIFVPGSAPDDAIIELVIDTIHYNLNRDDAVSMQGISTTREISMMDTTYYGEITQITPGTSFGDQDISITGCAKNRKTEEHLSNALLNLIIEVKGFERNFKVLTDENGEFSYAFTPLDGESGIYNVYAVHPDLKDRNVQGQFIIKRVMVTPSGFNLTTSRNHEKTLTVQVRTDEGTQLSNVGLVYQAEDQPGGVFPQGVQVVLGNPVGLINSGSTAPLSFAIWADNSADQTSQIILKIVSDESDAGNNWATLVVNTSFVENSPVLSFTPGHVETGVALPDINTGVVNSTTESIILKNTGLVEMKDVSVSLVAENNSNAPDWVQINTPADIGTIAVGESSRVDMTFSPGAAVTEGYHTFYLRVESSNHDQVDIGLYVAVTRSGTGRVLFKLSDIYTGTMNKETNEVIQGLAEATIRLQHDTIAAIDVAQVTDSFGESLFEGYSANLDLPAGSYKYRITASDHQEQVGRLWIKPGITLNQEIFLGYNLVTVEWEVVPTTIEDKYEIVLNTTFKTDVPAPVIVAEPASVNLPDMKTGDVYNGEFTLTNHGLIQADALQVYTPADDAFYTYDLMEGIPDTIPPGEGVTIPYRVTCLLSSSLDGDGESTGGGCERYRNCVDSDYTYEAECGEKATGTARHCVIDDNGQCAGSGSKGVFPIYDPGGMSVVDNSGPAGGESSSTKPSHASENMEGVLCPPDPVCPCGDECCIRDISHEVKSYVDLIRGAYVDYVTDMTIKVLGHDLEIKRNYYDLGSAYTMTGANNVVYSSPSTRSRWHLKYSADNFKIDTDSATGRIRAILKDGIRYNPTNEDGTVFSSSGKTKNGGRISSAALGGNKRWYDKYGNWAELDMGSRPLRYVNKNNVEVSLIYETIDERVRLAGISDHFGNQVLWYEYDDQNNISAIRDASGRRVQYFYDRPGKISKVIDVLGQETRYIYSDNGMLIEKHLPNGNKIYISYNAYGYISAVKDQNGTLAEYGYTQAEGANAYYARITEADGKIIEKFFDLSGNLTRRLINGETINSALYSERDEINTDADGNSVQKIYDEWGNNTSVIYPDGSSISYEYELKYSNITKATDQRGIVYEYEYDDHGNMTRMIEAAGTVDEKTTVYTYDDYGNMLSQAILGDSNTEEALTEYEYDDKGNLIRIRDPEGNETGFTSHDIIGNVLTKVDARGKTWQFEYDADGKLTMEGIPGTAGNHIYYEDGGKKIRQVDSELKETVSDYDDNGNLIKIADAAGKTYRFEYDSNDNLLQQTDPENRKTMNEYDDAGHLLKQIDGNGNEIELEYGVSMGCSSCSANNSDRLSKTVFPTFTREYKYDSRGRKTEEKDILIDTEGYITSVEYDNAGNLIFKKDREDKITQYKYDSLNRLTKVIDPKGNETIYTYDDRDNLIALKDPAKNMTWFEYDKNNRLKKEIRPRGKMISYQYDRAGNISEKIDSKGQKTEYGYNDTGHLITVRYYTAVDQTTPVKTVTFTYDSAGNLKSYNDGITSATYEYDDVYRKTSETVHYGAFSKTHAYTYYDNGTKKTFTGPDGITYGYLYDNNDQLTGIQIPNQGFVTINKYKWTRPSEITLPGGTKKNYEYDPLMRLNSISVKDPGENNLMNYQYGYDRMDNILTKNTEHGNYSYNYDYFYQLTGAENPLLDDETFSYDDVGNRKTATDVAGEWAYNENNELLGYDDVTYGYDANGNTIGKIKGTKATTYGYDIEDRLVAVWDGEAGSGTLIAEYNYDPFGRRLWKDANGVRTCFYYADEGLVGEYDVGGNGIKTYGWKPGGMWTTDPVFMKVGEEYYYYHNDHLGTPMQMTDVTGGVVWKAQCKSFGEAVIKIRVVENNLRFSGQYYVEETGYHYNWYRTYNPQTGRYLVADPIGFEGGINLYSYVSGNPVNLIDPKGLTAKCPLFEKDIRKSSNFKTYGNFWRIKRHFEEKFHCGFNCYLENRKKRYCPEDPGAECCYDKKKLVTMDHEYWGCMGSNDDYDCKDPISTYNHKNKDRGGPSSDWGPLGIETTKRYRKKYPKFRKQPDSGGISIIGIRF
jgi:RHS repeat-associated protein